MVVYISGQTNNMMWEKVKRNTRAELEENMVIIMIVMMISCNVTPTSFVTQTTPNTISKI